VSYGEVLVDKGAMYGTYKRAMYGTYKGAMYSTYKGAMYIRVTLYCGYLIIL
jgi:hypothetical protein